jgi:hypothetical protein
VIDSTRVLAAGSQRAVRSDAIFYHWKAKCRGLEVNEARRLRALEEENSRLKKIVAQQALDIDALKVTAHRRGARSDLFLPGRQSSQGMLQMA